MNEPDSEWAWKTKLDWLQYIDSADFLPSVWPTQDVSATCCSAYFFQAPAWKPYLLKTCILFSQAILLSCFSLKQDFSLHIYFFLQSEM